MNDSDPTIAVIVVAAGSGTRLGRAEPKAFASLPGGSLLAHALRGIAAMRHPTTVIVVAPASHLAEATAAAPDAIVVAGGDSRQASVALGLAALPDATRIVLVHDAARALAPGALFDRVVEAVAGGGAGIVPALPVTDTLKRVGPGGVVEGGVGREGLEAAQTPQGFPRAVLERAHAEASSLETDDAALVAGIGHPVRTIPGDELAFKITTPRDLERAAAALGGDRRSGVGVDAHAFEPGVPLWLGGVHWPDAPAGLAGHSDGDVACHALVDALLSAAGLGDIGTRFGTADPRLAGAAGATFLRETIELLAAEGWTVQNAAVEIVATAPRIGPRRTEMESVLTELMGAPVSVAATTTDGLGFTGDGSGVAAVATALIARS